MQNPNKPIGLSRLFKSLCGLGIGKILEAIEGNVLRVVESRVQHGPEKVTQAQLQPVLCGMRVGHCRRQLLGMAVPQGKA